MGIKLQTPPISAFPRDQVFYTFNHNSYLDTLIITALGLPNNRFLLSEKTLKILPLTLSALGIGTLYIPLKKAKESANPEEIKAASDALSAEIQKIGQAMYNKDNKDKDKKDQDKNKDQKKDQDKKDQDQKDKEDQKQKPQPQQMSKEDAQRMLDALANDEKKVQDKVNKQKVQANPKKAEKDW